MMSFFFPIQPKSAEHILEALDSGNRNRTQHPTDMNATSSRSHAVFQVFQFSLIQIQKLGGSMIPLPKKKTLTYNDLYDF